jgi:hypothetical protein
MSDEKKVRVVCCSHGDPDQSYRVRLATALENDSELFAISVQKSCGWEKLTTFPKKYLTCLDLKNLISRIYQTKELYLDRERQFPLPTTWDDQLVQKVFSGLNIRPLTGVNDILVYRVFIEG